MTNAEYFRQKFFGYWLVPENEHRCGGGDIDPENTCRKLIHPGERCFFMGNVDRTIPNPWLCKKCAERQA